MNYHTLFFSKIGKMSQNLSSAAVVIGAIRMDHAKLLEVLTSLPVSHAIIPRAMCFAMSRPANHAICSYIDLSEYASGPIRICVFIDYKTNTDAAPKFQH